MSRAEYSLRLSAILDGELSAAELAAVTRHLANCPECMRHFSELAEMRASLQQAIPEEDVAPEFYDKIAGLLDLAPLQLTEASNVVAFKPRARREITAWLAAGTAVAAMLAVALMPHRDETKDLMSVRDAALRGGIPQSVAASTGPAVAGFHLASSRPDVVAGHQAQVRVYVRDGQIFTLCVWAADGEPPHGVRQAVYKGTPIIYWNNGKQEYWATTAGPDTTLDAFVDAVRHS